MCLMIALAIGAVTFKSVFPAVKEVPFKEPGLIFRMKLLDPFSFNSTFTLSIKIFKAAFVAP